MEALTEKKLRSLEASAEKIREHVIEMLLRAGSGHAAGSLGTADIFSALYFHILRHDPKRPQWDARDRFVLSAGHICPAQYAALALAGYFPIEKLKSLRALGSPLQGHPHRGSLPGVETTSGPLGSGLAQAVGMALAARLNGAPWRVYCLTSDGEHNEGNHWEAVMAAAKYRLSNLTVIVDRNFIQIDGTTERVMPLESLKEKYEAFKWHAVETDGNDVRSLIGAVREAEVMHERPTAIIAKTIPGKGVSFMERNYLWHGKAPSREEAAKALRELRTLRGKISSDLD
jgi:transketolase